MPAALGAVEFFGIVHALDSSGPDVKKVFSSNILYAFFIRVFNPAYPEGMMMAILLMIQRKLLQPCQPQRICL